MPRGPLAESSQGSTDGFNVAMARRHCGLVGKWADRCHLVAGPDTTIAQPTHDAATIRRVAGLCLKRVPLDRRLRLLGVRVGSLSKLGAKRAGEAAAAGSPHDAAPLF